MKKIIIIFEILLFVVSSKNCFGQTESTETLILESAGTFIEPFSNDNVLIVNDSKYDLVVYEVYWETANLQGKTKYDTGVHTKCSLLIPYGGRDIFMLKVEAFNDKGEMTIETYPASFHGGSWVWIIKNNKEILTQDKSILFLITERYSDKEKKTPRHKSLAGFYNTEFFWEVPEKFGIFNCFYDKINI